MPAGRRDRVSNQATSKEGGVRGGGRCLDGGDGDEARYATVLVAAWTKRATRSGAAMSASGS